MPPTMPNGTPANTTSGLVTLLNWKHQGQVDRGQRGQQGQADGIEALALLFVLAAELEAAAGRPWRRQRGQPRLASAARRCWPARPARRVALDRDAALMVAAADLRRDQLHGELDDLADRHPGVGRRADHVQVVDLLDPGPLVAPQAEGDRNQPVLLAQVGAAPAPDRPVCNSMATSSLVMPARFALSVLIVTRDLERPRTSQSSWMLSVPGISRSCLLGLGGHRAERFDVVAEEADLHGHADGRTGFQLLDRHPGRSHGRAAIRVSAATRRPVSRAVGAYARGSGRSCRPAARARSRARIAARPGRRRSCRRGSCCLPVPRLSRMTLSALVAGLADGRAFGQKNVDAEDAVQVLGEKGRAQQGQQRRAAAAGPGRRSSSVTALWARHQPAKRR